MNSKERFHAVLSYLPVDRVPYFEEGIRPDVIRVWKKQGLSNAAELANQFPLDPRHELSPNLYPLPAPDVYPETKQELDNYVRLLNPAAKDRFPKGWQKSIDKANQKNAVTMLQVHEGFFLSLGVYGWQRFEKSMLLLHDDPKFVKKLMNLHGEFSAVVADRILQKVSVDAAIFSEPIGGNHGALISPSMYEEFVLKSYQPLFAVLTKHKVEKWILRTYANAKALIPKLLKWGINCLWACEVNQEAMDYLDLRREFGRDLRLIGGIDLDTLREGKEAIRDNIERRVPLLLQDGGYIPLADGRVRADVPYQNYVFYRQELDKVINQDDSI